MMIQFEPALPCTQYLMDVSPPQLCGKLATQAIISPEEDGLWEMVPVCSEHLREVTGVDPKPGTDHSHK